MKTKEQLQKHFEKDSFSIIPNSSWIYRLAVKVCTNYLHIDVPTLMYQTIMEDGRYYRFLNTLAITVADMGNDLEIKKTLYHELRHAFQINYVKTHNNEISSVFKKEVEGINDPIMQYLILDIDAFAFQKKMMKELDNIIFRHQNPLIDELLMKYEVKYFTNFDE